MMTLQGGVLCRHHRSPGDVENHACNPCTLIRGEEQRGGGDIIRQAEAPERMGVDELLPLCSRDACVVAFREDRLGRDAVDADVVRTGLRGNVLREYLD